MRSRAVLLSFAVVLAAACDGGSSAHDAAVFDAPPDGAGDDDDDDDDDDDVVEPDAIDALPPIDGGADAPVDAALDAAIDAGDPLSVENVCAELCTFADGCVGGKTGPTECLAECPTPMAECSEEERGAVLACTDGTCEALIDCVEAVPCLGGGGGTCEHDLCSTGTALVPGCDACVDTVCGVDSYCCNNSWDLTCVDEAIELCVLDCPSVCGDFECSEDESCATCSDDCGVCPPVCGDGACGAGECSSCEEDCPDGCNCVHDVCLTGVALDPTCEPCAAAVCAADSYCCATAWDGICVDEVPQFCGFECAGVCGDFVCDPDETCATCPGDCGACPPVCGDGACGAGECSSCEEDCPEGCSCAHDVCVTGVALDPTCDACAASVCASDSYCCATAWDGICVDEVPQFCGVQCPAVCGDFTCESSESCESCPGDCGLCPPVCGDNLCAPGECGECDEDCDPETCQCSHSTCKPGPALASTCDECSADICAVDSFCCTSSWDGICVGESESICGLDCIPVCGDSFCDDPEENFTNCPADC